MTTSNCELIRGVHNLRPEHHGNVVTIGSFDGVHLGHQAILQQVLSQSKRLQLPSLAMIFEPQPHEFFAGEKAPARLMRLGEKVEALFAEGIDRVFCLPFNQSFSQLSAEAFIQEILVDGLGVSYLVVGDDFRFGAGREGTYTHLVAAGNSQGFTVNDTESFLIDGERVSSTRIRALLQANQFEKAKQLLGKPYTIGGRVVKGNQLGRELDAPTANVHLHRYRSPLVGVFAVLTTLPSGQCVTGVANVGVRPTVSESGSALGNKPILEVHLFDFNDDLYGQHIQVEFKHKLRDEQRFSGLDALQEQIKQDMLAARQFFSSVLNIQ